MPTFYVDRAARIYSSDANAGVELLHVAFGRLCSASLAGRTGDHLPVGWIAESIAFVCVCVCACVSLGVCASMGTFDNNKNTVIDWR